MKRKTVALSGMVSCALMTGVLAGMMATGFLALSPIAIVAVATFALGSMVFGAMGALVGIRGARLRLEDQDSFQASYNRVFRMVPGVVLILAGVSAEQSWRLWDHPDDKLRWFLAASTAASVFATIWIYALVMSGSNREPSVQRLIQDEFFQNNLAKARSDGFYAVLVAMTLCFFVGLVSAQWAIALLPLAAGSSVAYRGFALQSA